MNEEAANSKTLFEDLVNSVHAYSQEEGKVIVSRLMESLANLTSTDLLVDKPMPYQVIDRLKSAIDRINRHEPWQYVVGQADFLGRTFLVNPSVLIPRPETEELTEIVIEALKNESGPLLIVDVGTGSGCIAVTLAQELPHHHVASTDIRSEALEVAGENARRLNGQVVFYQHDILSQELPWKADVVVSNPPYIGEDERGQLAANVVNFEPHHALFTGKDPLTFYRALAQIKGRGLKAGGQVFVEINGRYGKEVLELFLASGFAEASLLRDLSGKDRFVRARA